MIKKFTLLFAVFSAFFVNGFAQLSGTYTIGGTTPDYATVQAAVTALSAGVSGPVVFNIRPGTYQGKVSMGNVVGTSATNTITFQAENGDSSSVIITDSSATTASSNFTILINGTDYLHWNKVTIERSGTNQYSTCVFVGSGSHGITFSNCHLTAGSVASFGGNVNACAIYLPLGGALDSSATFVDNFIEGNSYGLYLIGQSSVTNLAEPMISGNVFSGQDYCAAYLKNASRVTVQNNMITCSSANTSYTGIYFENVAGQSEISSNKITGLSVGGYGIYLLSSSGVMGSEALVANNFIEAHGTGYADGIGFNNSAYFNIYHNTVSITTSGSNSSCIYFDGNGSNSVNVLNNIFVNTGGGYAFTNYETASTTIISDYNDLFTPNSTNIGNWDTNSPTDLTDWQTVTGQDANSVSGDPQFHTSTDLHSGSTTVNDLGTPLSSVLTDIDGESRSASTPDIGADEFTPLSDNLGLMAIISPEDGCGDSATVIGVVIRNFGLNDQTGFDVTADVSGMLTTSLTETVSANLSTNQLDTLYFTTTLNTYAGGTLDVTIYTGLSGDQDLTNDTLHASYTFLDHPNAPVVVSPQTQCDNNVMLTADADSGDVLMWYDAMDGGNLLFVGDTFHTAVNTDTTFYVESHHGSGSTGCLRITEIETNGGGDYIEVQNLSGIGFDATGYKVVASDDYTDINLVNSLTWDLGYFNPHEIQYRTDDAADNYWGNNLLWNPSSNGWAMILDPNGAIVDFVAFDWDSATIQSMNITVGSFTNITPGSEWSGDGMSTACSSTGITNHRLGSDDHNSNVDWDCETATKGTQNPNLDATFLHCGVGACASPRQEIQVTIIPGITASLGPDLSVTNPFSVQLSPGQGYTSYLWSTGETTDTITVTTVGVYWVTVTGGNGCTFTDTINVVLDVSVAGTLSEDAVSFYPNPASNKLTIACSNIDLEKTLFRFFDGTGKEISGIQLAKDGNRNLSVDLTTFPAGMYFIQVLNEKGTLTKRINVVK
ncbi:MAG: T9SS type A sorting domain-containing protein [Bacteroidia bacterium]